MTKIAINTVPKKDLIIELRYLRKISLPIYMINHVMKNKLLYRNQVVF